MIVLSSRTNFWSSWRVSSGNVARDYLSLHDTHAGALTKDDVLARLAGKRVCILVHGYRVSGADVRRGYTAVESAYREQGLVGRGRPYDDVLGWIWPGGRFRIAYMTARLRAARAAPHLAHWLAAFAQAGVTVDVNCHSLGASVFVRACEGLAPGTIRHAFLLAPAVDNETFGGGQSGAAAARACERIHICRSENDPVLFWLYPLFDWDRALGLSGPEGWVPTNVQTVDFSDQVSTHSGYKNAPAFWDYVRWMLAEGTA